MMRKSSDNNTSYFRILPSTIIPPLLTTTVGYQLKISSMKNLIIVSNINELYISFTFNIHVDITSIVIRNVYGGVVASATNTF